MKNCCASRNKLYHRDRGLERTHVLRVKGLRSFRVLGLTPKLTNSQTRNSSLWFSLDRDSNFLYNPAMSKQTLTIQRFEDTKIRRLNNWFNLSILQSDNLIIEHAGRVWDIITGLTVPSLRAKRFRSFRAGQITPKLSNSPTPELCTLAVKNPAKTNKKQQSYRVKGLESFRVNRLTLKPQNSQTLNSAIWRKK